MRTGTPVIGDATMRLKTVGNRPKKKSATCPTYVAQFDQSMSYLLQNENNNVNIRAIKAKKTRKRIAATM
jgi:hypothetical protein